jgi:hypothetical protein
MTFFYGKHKLPYTCRVESTRPITYAGCLSVCKEWHMKSEEKHLTNLLIVRGNQ